MDDLLRFAHALTDHKLLSAESTALITSGKYPLPGSNTAEYGYGFGVETINGYRRFGHSGGFPGINSQLNIYPELGYVVAVMSNYDPPAATRVAERIGKLITGSAIPQPISLAADELALYAHSYTNQNPNMGPPRLELMVEDGALWLIVGAERHRFLPLSATEFYDEEVEDVRLKFTLTEEGRPTAVTVEGAAPEAIRFVAE
ncbi:MAG: serine hydrolase [Caldilineaceae bacterium]